MNGISKFFIYIKSLHNKIETRGSLLSTGFYLAVSITSVYYVAITYNSPNFRKEYRCELRANPTSTHIQVLCATEFSEKTRR